VGDAGRVRHRPDHHRDDRASRTQSPPEVSALKPTSPPFAYEGLDRIFHERGRLAVCTCLVANGEGLSFTALAEACGLTDGNLNRHLHALAETGIVRLSRTRGRGRPTTLVSITKPGRARFLAYIDELEVVIRTVHEGEREREASPALSRLAAHA
jgi:DNA-binding MarR family transcriptional regulator